MLKISADFVSQVINKEKKKILMEAGKGKKAREEIQWDRKQDSLYS